MKIWILLYDRLPNYLNSSQSHSFYPIYVSHCSIHHNIHAILNSDEDEERLTKIKRLIAIFESSEQITEFDEEKFSSIVERIIVLSEKEIRFELIGGIAFNESIQRKGR